MDKTLEKVLKELGIKYDFVEHQEVHTIEDMEKLENNPFEGIEICKNLFLRDQKGKRHFLVVVCQNKQVNISELQNKIGSTRLSFASEERLKKHLGLVPGSVTPCGLINNEENDVEVIIDKDLEKFEKVAVHPNTNTASLIMSFNDLKKFLESSGNDIKYIKI